jgi:hypothetical protein
MPDTKDDRWRCLVTGCNPYLTETTAVDHKGATGHRVAAWPIRSASGQRRAQARNKSGYYTKYNTGNKSYEAFQDRTGQGKPDETNYTSSYTPAALRREKIKMAGKLRKTTRSIDRVRFVDYEDDHPFSSGAIGQE